MTKHPNVRETPAGKNGNRRSAKKSDSSDDEDDFDDLDDLATSSESDIDSAIIEINEKLE